MYSDISTTKPESLRLVSVIDRQDVPSTSRVKAVAMGLGLALAKNLPYLAATNAQDAFANYKETHEPDIHNFVGALNELTPIDTKLTRLYAGKFYQLVYGVAFQNIDDYVASTAKSVGHALLGTELYFSQDDIAFMEQYSVAVLKIAAAAIPVLNLTA